MVSRWLAALAAALALPAWCAQDLLLEAQLEPPQVYVQSQAIYRLRLYQAVDVRDLTLAPPSSRVADLRQTGSGRVYEALRDGRRYRVHERSYAVFPFASGALVLAGAHAAGRVPAPGANAPDGRQAVRIDAPPATLTVLPAPAGDSPWLPAQSLTLSETWSTAADGAQRRSVRIEAAGVDAAQLPELHFAAAGITVRAEPARLENRFAGERNIAVREQSFIVAPAGASDAALPALHVRWWHAGAGRLMTASLPPRMLRGAGGAPAATPARPAHGPLLLGAVLLAAAALAVCRKRADWRLLRACARGDARAVRDGLLAWSAAAWPDAPPRTLGALAERLRDAAAMRAVAGLERSLYGPGADAPGAAALRAIVRQVKRHGPQCRWYHAGWPRKRATRAMESTSIKGEYK